MPQISIRLKTIADFVKPNSAVCDIGCDHGYLAIYLMKHGKTKSVIAADIGEKPLKNAQKNIENAAVSGIDLRLCDGLSGIRPNETDTIICAGIGGEVIAGILDRGKSVAARRGVDLILQPTTSPEFLRRFLYQNGYEIVCETPVFENGQIYSVMLAEFADNIQKMPECFYYYGKVTAKTDEGKKYIEKQLKRNTACALALDGLAEKQSEYLYFKEVSEGIKNYLEAFKEG